MGKQANTRKEGERKERRVISREERLRFLLLSSLIPSFFFFFFSLLSSLFQSGKKVKIKSMISPAEI